MLDDICSGIFTNGGQQDSPDGRGGLHAGHYGLTSASVLHARRDTATLARCFMHCMGTHCFTDVEMQRRRLRDRGCVATRWRADLGATFFFLLLRFLRLGALALRLLFMFVRWAFVGASSCCSAVRVACGGGLPGFV